MQTLKHYDSRKMIAEKEKLTSQFDLANTLKLLGRTPLVLEMLLSHQDVMWTQAKKTVDSWSPFDIVGHLIHGEKVDWLECIKIMLSSSENKSLQPFDRFAQFESSKGKTMTNLVAEFKELRQLNVNFIKALGLNDHDLTRKGIHPKLGTVTVQQLIATWAAHDLNHLNQITSAMATPLENAVGPWSSYLTIYSK